MRTSFLCCLLAIIGLLDGNASGVDRGSIPGDALDSFGETIGGQGSGVCLDEKSGHYFLSSDRGPGDGTIDYAPRFHEVDVVPGAQSSLVVTVLKTTVYLDPNGKPMTGLIPDSNESDHPAMKDGRWCIDPEAIAVASDGTIYVSDEYGPFLYQFDAHGKMLRFLQPPESYLPKNAAGQITFGALDDIQSGRIANRGFEGLSLSADGKSAWLALQSALAQDGGKKAGTSRLLQLNLVDGKPIAEYLVKFTPADELNQRLHPVAGQEWKQKSIALSELLRVDDHHFLIIERDDHTALPAYKSVQLLDTSHATNLLGHDNIPTTAKAVTSTRIFDLTGLPVPGYLPEKWEGLTWAKSADSGPRRLLITTDNDFLTPIIQIGGKAIPFPKAPSTQDTLFFEVDLPGLR